MDPAVFVLVVIFAFAAYATHVVTKYSRSLTKRLVISSLERDEGLRREVEERFFR